MKRNHDQVKRYLHQCHGTSVCCLVCWQTSRSCLPADDCGSPALPVQRSGHPAETSALLPWRRDHHRHHPRRRMFCFQSHGMGHACRSWVCLPFLESCAKEALLRTTVNPNSHPGLIPINQKIRELISTRKMSPTHNNKDLSLSLIHI